MLNDKSILAIIPARGDSKGVPRKNIRNLAGKPLIAWTIEEAKKSKYVDRLILSSEDAEIISVANAWGCKAPFVRPAELSQDDTPGVKPVIHAISILPEKYDYVLLLQPTSPFRSAADIDGCIEHCIQMDAKACVSVTEPEKSPYWMYLIDDKERLFPLIATLENFDRRQDLPKVYALNGALYMANCAWLLNTGKFISAETIAYKMPTERSVDIDSEVDFKFAELFIGSNIAQENENSETTQKIC